MASKFQHRLVGSIILVALGVIVLPDILDGKKKHYQDEVAAISLIPKPGESDELNPASFPSQQLSIQPLEGAEEVVEKSKRPADRDYSASLFPDNASGSSGSSQPEILVPLEIKSMPPAAFKHKIKPPAASASKPALKPQLLKIEAPKALTFKSNNKLADEPAPSSQAWVVQLGALKNAEKVSEIIAKLRLSGYRVYTSPSAPVQGQITRIFIGPDVSKEKLQSALGELNQLSGLNGQLRPLL